ncbi:hypothetical protein K8942_05195 [Candidatus Peribacteria bacterium]|nr:MAG: hypothetical protein K8942_05195 [Candidatus Peribacteria bacterium]
MDTPSVEEEALDTASVLTELALDISVIAELVSSIIMELLDEPVSVSVVTDAVPLQAARARRETETAEKRAFFIQK